MTHLRIGTRDAKPAHYALPCATQSYSILHGKSRIPCQAPAIDAVPLIDAATATVLGNANGFTVRQRPSITEMFLGVERSNIYDIYDDSGRHIFFAKERSECWTRLCCAPRHSFFIEFKHSSNVPPPMLFNWDIDSLPVAMTLEREGCPSKWCLSCCAFHPACYDGMYLHAGPVQAEAGKVKATNPACVSFATQPKFGGGFTPTINVMERAATAGGAGKPHEPAWSTLAKIEGPTIFGGCSELCRSSKFSVSSLAPAQVDAKIASADLADIVKRKPADLDGVLREMVTDADVYTLVFNPGARLAPQQKASMLASLVLADFMFFERDDAACSSSGCNLCNFYCCGCLCPCSCVSGSASSSRGGGGGSFMGDQ